MLKSIFKGFTEKKRETSNDPLLAYVIDACTQIEDRSLLKQKVHETSFCVLDLETT